MNLFNRILLVLLALLGLVGGIALIAVALTVPEGVVAYFEAWAAYFGAGFLWQLTWAGVAAGGVLSLVSLALLLLELGPRRRRLVQISRVGGDAGMLTVDSVARRIRHEVEALDQVKGARPRVTSRGQEVDVHLDLHTDLNTPVKSKDEEIRQVVRQTVEEGLGVKLRRLEVEFHQEAESRPA